MGYYTTYSLEIKNVNDEQTYHAIRQAMIDKGIINYALYDDDKWPGENRIVIFQTYDMVKWYESTEDMTDISRMFPDCVFRLSGEGEETGDIWERYFKNGKNECCMAKIVMPKPKTIRWE